MPLLNAIILTGMNTILPFVQVWLPGEAEPDFVWALSKLKALMEEHSIPLARIIVTDRDLACTNVTETVFPLSDKLFCRWHIRRNVLAQAKKKIGLSTNKLAVDIFMARFDATVSVSSVQEFNERCEELRRLSPNMCNYLDAQWWPHNEKIVSCWTNNYSHFGCRDTSAVEDTQATMKAWLGNSRGDLLHVFQSLLPWWRKQAASNKFKAAKDACQIPHLFRRDDKYLNLVKIIGVWAIQETQQLWKKAHAIVVNNVATLLEAIVTARSDAYMAVLAFTS